MIAYNTSYYPVSKTNLCAWILATFIGLFVVAFGGAMVVHNIVLEIARYSWMDLFPTKITPFESWKWMVVIISGLLLVLLGEVNAHHHESQLRRLGR